MGADSGAWTLAVRLSRDLPIEKKCSAACLAVMGHDQLSGFLLFMLMIHPLTGQLPFLPGRRERPESTCPAGFRSIVHPPMLYWAMVGFSPPCASPLRRLLVARLDAAMGRFVPRPWTINCLGLSDPWVIAPQLPVGLLRAGWGGWWFWDPVEKRGPSCLVVGTSRAYPLPGGDGKKRGVFKAGTVFAWR